MSADVEVVEDRTARLTRRRGARHSARFDNLINPTNSHNNHTPIINAAPEAHPSTTASVVDDPTSTRGNNPSDYEDNGSSDSEDNYTPSIPAPVASRKRSAEDDPTINVASKRPRSGKTNQSIPIEEALQGIGPVPPQQDVPADSIRPQLGSLLHQKRGPQKSKSPVWQFVYVVDYDPSQPKPIPPCPANARVLSSPPDESDLNGSEYIACRLCNTEGNPTYVSHTCVYSANKFAGHIHRGRSLAAMSALLDVTLSRIIEQNSPSTLPAKDPHLSWACR
jgi:hypothetical protein